MADYIGKSKVIGVAKVEDFTTPSGQEVVSVLLEGSHPKLMTKKAFDVLVTNKASDDSDLQKRKFEPMIGEMVKVLVDYDIQWYEVEAVIRSIKETIDMRLQRASSYKWYNGDDSRFIAGEDPSNYWSLLEAQQILNLVHKNATGKGDRPGEVTP